MRRDEAILELVADLRPMIDEQGIEVFEDAAKIALRLAKAVYFQKLEQTPIEVGAEWTPSLLSSAGPRSGNVLLAGEAEESGQASG